MNITDVFAKGWIVDHQIVISAGESDQWDDLGVHTPHILKDKDVYRMYYTGRSKDGDWAIGTATSTDLIHWDKHPEPILRSGKDWDKQLDFPWPIKVNDTYYLYLEAKESVQLSDSEEPPEIKGKAQTIHHMYTRSTGLATSSDGIHFQKHPHPVLRPDPTGTWDHNGICASRVYRHSDDYYMFYAGSDGNVARSGLAFSKDLLNWKRYEHNPVIDVGSAGAWDSLTTLFGSVVKLNDGYLGAYEGEDGRKMQIGLASSKDLKQWRRFDGNPIIQTEENYIEHNTIICAPCLVVHEGTLYLFYTHNKLTDGKLCRIEIARCRT